MILPKKKPRWPRHLRETFYPDCPCCGSSSSSDYSSSKSISSQSKSSSSDSVSSSPGSSSSVSTSSISKSYVTVPCCTDPISTVLYATFGGVLSAFGTIALKYFPPNPPLNPLPVWRTDPSVSVSGCGGAVSLTVAINCDPITLKWVVSVAFTVGSDPTPYGFTITGIDPVSCSPFVLTTSGTTTGPSGGSCDGGAVSLVISDDSP